MHILPLPPLPFHQGFTMSKLISFASWKRSRIAEWESTLLPVFTLPVYWARTSVVGARCHNPFVADICLILQEYQAKLQLALNKLCYMPSAPTHHLILLPASLTIQYNLTGHSIPFIIGHFEQAHNIIRIFVKMLCPTGARTGAFAVGAFFSQIATNKYTVNKIK